MTDKKTDVWMPLWIGAYLADTMAFTTEQHGAYLLLLFAYWRERSALPDDDEALRGITKLDRADWKRVRPVLAKKFRVADGVWWHKRVEQEMADADARAKTSGEKAKKAAQSRWEAQRKQAPSNASSNAQALLGSCPTPPPSPGVEEANASPPPGEGLRPSVMVAAALGSVGIEASPDNPRIVSLCDIGATVGEFTDMVPAALKANDPLAYLLTAVENGRRRAAEIAGDLHRGPLVDASVEAGKKAAESRAAYLAEEAARTLAAQSPQAHVARKAAMSAIKRIAA